MTFFNIERIKRITAEARDGSSGLTNATTLNEREQAIFNAVNTNSWGPYDTSVRELVKAITGVDCGSNISEESPFIVGAALFWRNATVLVRSLDADGDARFCTSDGVENVGGDSYICTDEKDWRYATDAEIDAFFGL